MTDRTIEEIANDILAAGGKFYIGGPNWVVIQPPPSAPIVMELVGRGDDLDDFVIRNKLYQPEPFK